MTVEPEIAPETFYIGAYWGPRKESPEECARRAAAFLTLLASSVPSLAHWYKPARSRKDARKSPLMPPDVPTLTELFRRGVNRETGGPAIEELGFRCSFDNGEPGGECATLRMNAGMYSEAVANHCVLTLPWKGPNAERVLTASALTNIVRSMALAWEPDWAVATSDPYRRLMNEASRAGTFVGWVTYLPRSRGTVPPLPAPVRIDPLEERGALIILTPERATASNSEHVSLGQRAGELLSRAGLLQPIIPP